MKERLVEDWLTRINERGYEIPFCQSLISKGYRILRCGHSPTEHGKDVIAIAPGGAVCAYQLKSGDVSQSEMTKHHEQIVMLVETRPVHPGLTEPFEYIPHFVTTGEYKGPATSLVVELNAGWEQRRHPRLTLIGGRQLLADFIDLSSDFWPISAPDVRQFRELYLVDGRGDLDLQQFAKFLMTILSATKSNLDMERRAAAANLFSSYLLGEFYRQEDHWSIVQGWTICAAQIAWSGTRHEIVDAHWNSAFLIARNAALVALGELAREVAAPGSFEVKDLELDELTRTRNTTAVAAAACFQLISNRHQPNCDSFRSVVDLVVRFLHSGRLLFWGEGALSQFMMLFWMMECGKEGTVANELLMDLIVTVASRNGKCGTRPIEDPYVSPDECLTKLFSGLTGKLFGDSEPSNEISRKAVESYVMLPLVLMAVRRSLRERLAEQWKMISLVELSCFVADKPIDVLLWRCQEGREHAEGFSQPQSWSDLRDYAFRNDSDRVPPVLQHDFDFSLIYFLVYQHRILVSLMKFIDNQIGPPISQPA